ncbi:MAG: DNA polymerase I [Fimbriimonadia bacterium]|jgi:DNA polymerase-1
MSDKSTRKTYIIVDGYSLAFRAFFATQLLTTSDGRPTNALFGLTNMLLSLLDKEHPYGIVVVFDAPGKTFRHAQFPEYKAHRKEADPALKEQLPTMRDLVAALGIPSLEALGFEADDLAGTLAKRAAEQGFHVLIVTGDNDQLQLVDENVTVRMTMRGISDVVDFTPELVRERFGFGPERIPDYKALRGDPSDNIPGVPGVGEKTATLLIQEFGTVEQIAERLNEIPPKYRSKLEGSVDVLRLGKELTTIVTDAPVEFDFTPYEPDAAALDRAREFLESLEFRSIVRRLEPVLSKYVRGGPDGVTTVQETPRVEVSVLTLDASGEAALRGLPEIGLAVSEDGVALSDGQSVWHAAGGIEWLADSGAPALRVHNARGVVSGLGRLGVARPRFAFDTELAAYVLAPGRGSYSLEDLARDYLGGMADGAAGTALACFCLAAPMTQRLTDEQTLSVFQDLEMPLIPVLLDMEEAGICVDREYLSTLSSHLSQRIDELARDVYAAAGREFNIGSPKQLAKVLFEEMGLPSGRKTKTGHSTDADVLGELAAAHPIAKLVIDWREVTKLKSTYADALPKMVQPDGRIHTTFNQTVAATGRLSSVDPNLQNIPVKTDLGREIRRAFVAPPGHVLLSLDYSQIELRLLAHMSEDPVLTSAFHEGLDIHAATAHSLFGIPENEVSPEQRRVAKMVNYAVLYGMSDFGLAQSLQIGVGEAHEVIATYFRQFPGVREFTESIVAQARRDGYTKTLLGRKRYFPEIQSSNRQMRMAAERAAINAPIQGSAADMIKLAMIKLYKSGATGSARLLLQVHDELLFECPETDVEVNGAIREVMASAMPLKVPVVVDKKVGPNWRDMS